MTETTAGTDQLKSQRERRMGSRRGWGPPLLIGLGLALILIAGLGFTLFLNTPAQAGEAPLPASLAGLPLGRAVYGEQALFEIEQLHGKTLPLASAAVGQYGAGGEATLWVAGTPSSVSATLMVRKMERLIETGDSPFRPEETRQVKGRAVYVLIGMGQRHYYYRSGSLVIWLAADSAIAEQVLTEVMDFYP